MVTDSDLNTLIGLRARYLRKLAGLSIKEVAERTEGAIKRNMLSYLERGKKRWNSDSIAAISTALDVYPRDLMPGNDQVDIEIASLGPELDSSSSDSLNVENLEESNLYDSIEAAQDNSELISNDENLFRALQESLAIAKQIAETLEKRQRF